MSRLVASGSGSGGSRPPRRADWALQPHSARRLRSGAGDHAPVPADLDLPPLAGAPLVILDRILTVSTREKFTRLFEGCARMEVDPTAENPFDAIMFSAPPLVARGARSRMGGVGGSEPRSLLRPLPSVLVTEESLASGSFPPFPCRAAVGSVQLYRPSLEFFEAFAGPWHMANEDLSHVLQEPTRGYRGKDNGFMEGKMWTSAVVEGQGSTCRLWAGQRLAHSNCVLTSGPWFTAGHFEYGCNESVAFVVGDAKLWIIAGTQTGAKELERLVRTPNDLVTLLEGGGRRGWFYCWATSGTTILQPWWAAHTVLTSTTAVGHSFVGGWEARPSSGPDHAVFCLDHCLRRWDKANIRGLCGSYQSLEALLQYSQALDEQDDRYRQDVAEDQAPPPSECTLHLLALSVTGVVLADVMAYSLARSHSRREAGKQRIAKHAALVRGRGRGRVAGPSRCPPSLAEDSADDSA